MASCTKDEYCQNQEYALFQREPRPVRGCSKCAIEDNAKNEPYRKRNSQYQSVNRVQLQHVENDDVPCISSFISDVRGGGEGVSREATVGAAKIASTPLIDQL